MKKDTKIDEKTLIEKCKKDKSAFSRIYSEYLDDIYRYVYVLLHNKQKAEDITSQTFLTALEKIDNFEWRGISIKFWLIRISKNLVMKSYRQKSHISFDEKIEIKELNKTLLEDKIIKESLKKELKKLIFKLDDITREIISLRIWEEFKFREIAKLLDMNESTVKNRFARGIKKLKRLAKQKDKKKIPAPSIAVILIGLKQIKNLKEFTPSPKLKLNLTKKVSAKTKTPAKGINIVKSPSILTYGISSIVVVGTLVTFGVVGSRLIKQSPGEKDNISEESQETNSSESDSTSNMDIDKQNSAEEGEDNDSPDTIEPADPYENWTYIELPECHVAFYYPSDWYIKEYYDGRRCIGLSHEEEVSGSKGVTNPFYMIIHGEVDSDPKEYYENLNSPEREIVTSSKEVDGQEALYVIDTVQYLGTYHILYYKVGDTYYHMSWAGTELENFTSNVDKLIDSIELIE